MSLLTEWLGTASLRRCHWSPDLKDEGTGSAEHPRQRKPQCRCPEVGQCVVTLLEIQVHASRVAGTTPRTHGEVGQYGGPLSAISALIPGMSTSYDLFLPKLFCNKMSCWHFSVNLSETNVLVTPTCSCSGVPSFEKLILNPKPLP